MKRHYLYAALVAVAISSVVTVFSFQDQNSGAALSGLVTSKEEGPMEGVVVSAKRADSTVTVSVVSDAAGRYSFPRNRLDDGQYGLTIRAIGYELEKAASAPVKAGNPATLDLKLRKTKDLEPQISNAEWMMSMPGTDEQKQAFNRRSCVYCHGLNLIVRSRHNAKAWEGVIERMDNYAQGTSLKRPQKKPEPRPLSDAARKQIVSDAAYFATVNLSSSPKRNWELKTLPRVKGKGTRVVVTEYQLPRRETLPHDVTVDAQGAVWYADFGSQFIGKLDPRTGKVVEYPLPTTKPGAPTGALDMRVDREGKLWVANMYQAQIARFDPKTGKFESHTAPGFKENGQARLAMVAPAHYDEGHIYVGGDSEYQVDLKSGQWHALDTSFYGVAVDSRNNGYGMQLTSDKIVKIDLATRKVTDYRTPTPDSGPRRGNMDAQDRLWFAESRGDKIAMFDTATAKFTEWPVPTKWSTMYDAIMDKAGFVWSGGMSSDRVFRLNPKTNEIVEYPLPGLNVNIRRVDVDNSTNPPTFWVGDDLKGTIVKVEPLEQRVSATK